MAHQIDHIPSVWWECSEGAGVGDYSVHRKLFPHVKAIEQDQEEIHFQNLLNVRLYTNRDMMAFEWTGTTAVQYRPIDHNLENVIQSVLDTLVSRIGKNRPKATIVTRDADFDVYLRGRQLDRYLWGEFLRQEVHRKGEQVFLDGLIFGTGVLKVDIDDYDQEIFTERVNPDEIIVDQRECMSCSEPQQMHHRRLVSRLWLKETYGDDPDLLFAIEHAQERNFQYTSYRSPAEDQIVVIESWKLPTRADSDDGRHVICIENATLLDEPYNRDRFPFVFFRWQDPKGGGFYGRSLVEDLTGYQIRLNELNEAIRVGQDVMCVPRVFVDQGSAILGAKFDNVIGRVVQFRGTRPEPMTWSAFNAEIYQERDRIRQSAFEFAGISVLSAQNKLPTQARLDSSEALREFNAIEDERFNHQAQAYEQFFMDVAHHLIERSAELFKRKKRPVDRKNVYVSGQLIEEITWSEVDMERDKYVLQVSASSVINMSPAARKDKLNEWAAAGVITQEEYKAWSGEPDLERLADLMSASNDYAQNTINKMLHGEPQTPDGFANIQSAYRVVLDTYLHLRNATKCPEDILQLFRDWMELAKAVLSPPQPALPTMSPGGAPMPGMDPGMMPPGPSMGAGGPPAPSQLPPGAPTNPVTGAPVPSVAMPAAQAFVG